MTTSTGEMSDADLDAAIKDARHWYAVVRRGVSTSAPLVAQTIRDHHIRPLVSERNTRRTRKALS